MPQRRRRTQTDVDLRDYIFPAGVARLFRSHRLRLHNDPVSWRYFVYLDGEEIGRINQEPIACGDVRLGDAICGLLEERMCLGCSQPNDGGGMCPKCRSKVIEGIADLVRGLEDE